jgi:hypothetical protein
MKSMHAGYLNPCIFHKTFLSKPYVILSLSHFHDQWTDEEKSYRHFMHDNAMACTVNSCMDALDKVFNEIIYQGLWLLCNFNPCDFYLWGTLKRKVYVNTSRTSRKK